MLWAGYNNYQASLLTRFILSIYWKTWFPNDIYSFSGTSTPITNTSTAFIGRTLAILSNKSCHFWETHGLKTNIKMDFQVSRLYNGNFVKLSLQQILLKVKLGSSNIQISVTLAGCSYWLPHFAAWIELKIKSKIFLEARWT